MHLIVPKTFLRIALCLALVAGAFALTNSSRIAPSATAATTGPSYWITNERGQVWAFGDAVDFGDLTGKTLNRPIVGMAPTPTNQGYWLVASDGGIFAYGDAKFFGSTGAIKLNKPIVGMASTPSGQGYWLVATDGGIFAYGDAAFYGSTGSIKLNQPIVGMAPTPTNRGYWLTASDGGIFAYGDARFFGSTGSIKLAKPITAMTPTPSNQGYWLVASDGGIFAYGDAKFYGSAGGGADNSYKRIIATKDGRGYWLVRNGGDAIAYGTAGGSAAATPDSTSSATPSRPMVGLLYNISGPGDLAVMFAMGESGKPYIWGGTGPSGYDCSGLVQVAWSRAGAALPRVANSQYGAGAKIPLDQLRPGDLVFWASNTADANSIYHDALYIGGNTVIMAPKTGDIVRTANIWSDGLMPYGVRPR